MDKIDILMEKLLNMNLSVNNLIVINPEAETIIHEIAEMCRKTELYKELEESIKVRYAHISADELYSQMLHKIVDAPTKFHIASVIRIMIPAIDDALNNQ
jgi:hypothetical protein